MSDWVTVIVALISGTAGVAGGFIPQWFQSNQVRQSRAEAAKQAQAKRLRGEFVIVLRAARACEQIAHDMNVVLNNETLESRNARFSEALAERIKDLDDAFVAIAIEPGAPDLEPIAKRVLGSLRGIAYGMSYNEKYAGTAGFKPLETSTATIAKDVQELRSTIRHYLGSLMPGGTSMVVRAKTVDDPSDQDSTVDTV